MKFEVDVGKLIDYGITLNQYIFCQFIYQQDSKFFNFYQEQFKFVNKQDLDSLVTNGFLGMNDKSLGYRFSNFYVTSKYIDSFIERPKPSKVENKVTDWIDTWFELFPKGIKSGGYLVRSDKAGCTAKMQRFIKKYPQFNKDIILKATADYLDYYRMRNWAYVSLAHYFIFKNDVSILAGQCEMIIDKIEQGQDVNLTIDQYKTSDSYEQADGMERL